MKRNWYRRMLLSYFPIFFITVAILIFVFIIVVSDISYKQTVKADRITTDYMVGRLTSSLKGIELDVLKEIEKNKRYEDFLNVRLTEQDSQIILDVAGSMRELVASDSLIHSIYIYRNQDQKVLTRSGLVEWNAFADRSFIEQALMKLDTRSWSPIRSYREFSSDQDKRVVSMYKREPLPFGNDGLVVINIDVYAIEQMIRSMNSNEVSFLDVRDAFGELLFSTRSSDHASGGEEKSRVVNRVKSDLLGWQFESGIAAGQLFLWVSLISYIWVVVSILTIVLALLYIVFITKKNYKPIRTMMSRIESLREREDGLGLNRDEMSMIDQTLENLIRQAADFEKQQRENLLVSRRQLFYDIMQGEKRGMVDERLKKLGVHPNSEDLQLAFVVVEIRNYHDFRSTFSERDQRTLKFALTNVLQELAHIDGMYCWAEWVAEERMGMIVGVSSQSSALNHIKRFADKGREWVEQHLRFSLLFCIGQVEQDWQHMKRSYKAAVDVLQHKLSLGKEAIMMSNDLPEAADRKWYEYVLISSELVKEFRHLDGEWRTCLERLFEHMKKDCLKDEDISTVLQMMMDMLGYELSSISDELYDQFKAPEVVKRLQADENTGSLEDLKVRYFEYLTEIYRLYVVHSESKNHRAMIGELKAYIEDNFENPDLSLKHLSDRFHISAKYASYLFKEEFNLKFVDFMVKLRMERAQELLAETNETIQNISTRVGYANSITFGRVFKRVVGVTPGEYRRLKLRPEKSRH